MLQGVPRPPGSPAASRFLAWCDEGHVAVFPDQGRLEVHQHLPLALSLSLAFSWFLLLLCVFSIFEHFCPFAVSEYSDKSNEFL